MRRKSRMVGASLASIAVALVALPAGGSGNGKGGVPVTVRATLSEYKIELKRSSAPAGKIRFKVTNAGTMNHELIVIRTNRAPGDLPVRGSQASEKGAVGEIEEDELGPGDTRSLTLRLKRGKYVLICNVPDHYQNGQYLRFIVT